MLTLLLLAAPACERRSERGAFGRSDAPPIRTAATVLPLAQILSSVGGPEVHVHWLAERGQHVADYGDRPGVPAYHPPDRELENFQEAQILLTDGRCDRWALVGRSLDAMTGSGPVLQIHRLQPAEELLAAGAAGASWLDPLTLAAAAHETAERLSVIRPEQAEQFARNADRLAERLRGLPVGLEPRWTRVAIISSEPTPLLARLGIEPVLITPRSDEVVPDPSRLGNAARVARVQAVLLPADWAEANRHWWEERLGLPVAIYDALGSSNPADSRSDLIALLRFNLEQLGRPGDHRFDAPGIRPDPEQPPAPTD